MRLEVRLDAGRAVGVGVGVGWRFDAWGFFGGWGVDADCGGKGDGGMEWDGVAWHGMVWYERQPGDGERLMGC